MKCDCGSDFEPEIQYTHYLICGDCTDEMTVERLINGNEIGAVITDPPYGINFNPSWFGGEPGPGMKNPKNIKSKFSKSGIPNWDKNPFDPSHIFKLSKTIALFGANFFCLDLPDPGTWWVWDKRGSEAADELIGIPYELIWINKKCTHKIIRYNWAGITARERNEEIERLHYTQKPIEVISQIIDYLVKSGNILLDTYLGSGTTIIAAERLGRRCFAVEISPHYCAVALERYYQMTNIEPVLIEEG